MKRPVLFAGKSIFDLTCHDLVWAPFQIFFEFWFEFCVEYAIKSEANNTWKAHTSDTEHDISDVLALNAPDVTHIRFISDRLW